MDLITRYDKAGTYSFKKLKPILTKILKLYWELGGQIITIGSDSHKPEHLGTFINETKQELKALGFKKFCTFDKMQPIYHQYNKFD